MSPTHADRIAASVPVLEVKELGRRELLVIDLRSPSEFEHDHVPGARNVPLFDDAERAVVGTLYKQSSPDDAFARGAELVADKVNDLVSEIARVAGWSELPSGARAHVAQLTCRGIDALSSELSSRAAPAGEEIDVAFTCWRGGLRSQSVVALLQQLGVPGVAVVAGGYKAYRREVRATLDEWQAPPAFVLRGLTGVGKTLVLRELERQRPRWTIDLEGAAGHRSSLLGMVGLEPVSQKTFESRLAQRVREGFPGPVVFEGESRRVGDAIVPDRLWEALRDGTNFLLEAPVERRVEVLVEDYLAHPENRVELEPQLDLVEARMSRKLGLSTLLREGREAELVELLLEHYYDPLYLHGERRKSYAAKIDASDPVVAAREIVEEIERIGRTTP